MRVTIGTAPEAIFLDLLRDEKNGGFDLGFRQPERQHDLRDVYAVGVILEDQLSPFSKAIVGCHCYAASAKVKVPSVSFTSTAASNPNVGLA